MAQAKTKNVEASENDAIEITPTSLDAYFKPIEEMGLESFIARLDNYGYTVIPPEIVAPPEFIDRITDAVLRVAQERTGIEHRLDEINGNSIGWCAMRLPIRNSPPMHSDA